MEPNSDPPPFWSPPASSMIRRRRSPAPPLVSLPVLIIVLPTLALILLFFAIRPFFSLTSQLSRPNSVKKSWDSFNVFLVLIAIICGIFARRNDDVSAAADGEDTHVSDDRRVDAAVKVNGDSEFSQQWFGFTERRLSDPSERTPGMATSPLKRNSSYPDLRQESFWECGDGRPPFRFFDDFEINKQYRSRSSAYRTRASELEASPEIKEIPVDSFRGNSSPAPERLKSSAPPPPPPPPVTHMKPRRSYLNIHRKKEVREVSTNNTEFAKTQTPPPPPPPPLPPRLTIPPSPVRIKLEEKFGKSERKKTNVKKEIAMALASLYKQRKKRKRQKSKNIYDGERISPAEPRPTPSPPPPPPPPSVFRGLFRKASKNKRVHSESAPPPPPPPPPPPQSSRRRHSTTNNRPPLPTTRVHDSHVENANISSGRKSPSITIPPPAPPPPSRRTAQKSGGEGDFVSLKSTETSRCGSLEPEDVDSSEIKASPEKVIMGNGGGGVGPIFCPSPDVDIKAANFIARLRDEWRLEKMNSVRERERSSQGPNHHTITGPGLNIED